MHKFISDSSAPLANIPKTDFDDCGNVNLVDSDNTIHRTLGIQWNMLSDEFSYKLTKATKCLTRKVILSTIASIFGLLGLIDPQLASGYLNSDYTDSQIVLGYLNNDYTDSQIVQGYLQ